MIARIVDRMHHWHRAVLVFLAVFIMVAGIAAPGEYKFDQLNFTKAEIALVLQALSDLSSTNIVVSPAVKGEITVNLNNVTVEEALSIITNISGLTYTKVNDTYLVNVKEQKAPAPAVVDYQIISLRYLSGEGAAAALGVAFKDLTVKDIPGAKRVVLSGDKTRLQDAVTFLQQIDVDTSPAPAEIAEVYYQVKSLVPGQVKAFLLELYGAKGLTVGFAPGRAVPGATTGATTGAATGATGGAAAGQPAAWESDRLLIRGPRAVVDQAVATLSKTDVDVPLIEKRCTVERIQPAQAITYLLERFESRGLVIYTAPLSAADPAAAAKGPLIGSRVVRDAQGKLNVTDGIGDFIMRAPQAVITEAATALTAVDVGPRLVTKVVDLHNLKATEAQKSLKDQFGAKGLRVILPATVRGATPTVATGEDTGSSTATGGATSQTNDSAIHSLILEGPEDVVTLAEAQLAQFDVAPAQVSIRAEMISIDSSEIKNLGINWGGVSGGTTTIGSTTVNVNEVQSGNALELGRIIRTPLSLSATINALETRNKAKIISRPSTVVQDGLEAQIHVGDQVFFETLTGYTAQGPLLTTQSINTGVTLKVRPSTAPDGTVTLEITSNVTEPPTFRRSSTGTDLPSFRETRSATVVQVHDGETLVIGGLVQTRQEEIRQGIPVLSRIPLLGGLFSSKRTSPSQTELLVIVTPTILKPGAAVAQPTAAEINAQ